MNNDNDYNNDNSDYKISSIYLGYVITSHAILWDAIL